MRRLFEGELIRPHVGLVPRHDSGWWISNDYDSCIHPNA